MVTVRHRPLDGCEAARQRTDRESRGPNIKLIRGRNRVWETTLNHLRQLLPRRSKSHHLSQLLQKNLKASKQLKREIRLLAA